MLNNILVFLYIKAIIVFVIAVFLLTDPIIFYFSSKKNKKLCFKTNTIIKTPENLKKKKQRNTVDFIIGMVFIVGFIFFEVIPLVPDTRLFILKQIPSYEGKVTRCIIGKPFFKINSLYITTDNNKEVKVFVLNKNFNVGDYVKGEYFPNSKYGYAYSIKE